MYLRNQSQNIQQIS